jgi:hypothetical protein
MECGSILRLRSLSQERDGTETGKWMEKQTSRLVGKSC